MVSILQNSTNTATDIALSDLILETKVSSLQSILANYQRLCKEAAAIYISLGSLNRINPMLNWSYASFIKIFLAACLESVSEEQPMPLGEPEEEIAANESAMYESFVFSVADSRPGTSSSRMMSRHSRRSSIKDSSKEPASPKNYRSVQKEEFSDAANQIYKRPDRIIDK